MVHLYYGDGKGKTTCAFGLALRAAGRGKRVVIAQFLKSGDSGERLALAHVPGVRLLDVPEKVKFTFAMDDGELRAAAERCAALLAQVEELAAAGEWDMAVLDECCAALSAGLLPLAAVTDLLDRRRELEIVLTGREADSALLDRADYATELRKRKHPYDRGVPARLGVEW